MTDIDVRALRYFCAVAQFGSYSQAALHLRISQPAVSRQVLLLERTLKTRLFRKLTKGFALTETGIALYEKAQKIVGEVDSLYETLGDAARLPRGRLTIGVSTAISEYLMPDVMRRYRSKYPDVAVHIVQSYPSALTNLLVSGSLDMALLYGNPRMAELELKGLMDLEMGLVLPPAKMSKEADQLVKKSSVSLETVSKLPLITAGKGQDLRRMVDDAFSTINMEPHIVIEVDGISLAKALVNAGLGFTILAYNAVHAEVMKGNGVRFLPIVEPTMQWRLFLATRRLKPETLPMRAMAAEVSEAIINGVRGRTWQGKLLLGKETE